MADKDDLCPVCGHPSSRHWDGVRGGKLVWICKDCPKRQCQSR